MNTLCKWQRDHEFARIRQKVSKNLAQIYTVLHFVPPRNHCGNQRKGIRGYSFQFFSLYSRISKYEFPKRSLYVYWDKFKQSVGLQGFYQFYYTLAKCLAERARQCEGTYKSIATLYSSPSFSCVQSVDKEILKWLSICPKYSHKLPKSFSVTTEKIRKQKHRPKIGKLFYSDDTRKTETKDKQRKYRLGSLFQVENGKVDLSECTKLSLDERLVASDPDMFGYRTFVVIKALDHGAKFRRSRSYRCEQT